MSESDARLPALAIEAIGDALASGRRRLPAIDALPAELTMQAATFVTLEREGELLGCVGTLEATRALGVDVAQNALAAAFDDPRVPSVGLGDFSLMAVKVSVLSPLRPLAARSRAALVEELRPGLDGILVEAGRHRATFLPAVWPKVCDADDFVDELWRKAGLGPHAWPDGIRVFTYSTVDSIDEGPRDAPITP
ncbi:MAG: AmmeMemoRadiSam system protein A [Acidimicrobiia bacterium]